MGDFPLGSVGGRSGGPAVTSMQSVLSGSSPSGR